jgi:glycosyltransferase involved in cell wall biosynthesis
MKILYLHQYFRKSEQSGSHRSLYIAQAMQQQAWQVEVITAHNAPQALQEELAGMRIHYLPIAYSNHFGFWKRLQAFGRFVYQASRQAASLKEVDWVYASSTPLSIGLIALWLKYRYGKKYIFEVRDLWPQAPIEMGYVRNWGIQKLLYALEKLIYRKAEGIVALSPTMADYIRGLVPAKPICVVPNMSDTEIFKNAISKNITNQSFIIAYFGAIAPANGLEHLLEIAALCAEKDLPVEFWLIGEGSSLGTLQVLREEKRLSNIRFFAPLPKTELALLLQQVQAVFVSFAEYQILESCSPNKFFDALAAQKLIITNTSGWIRKHIEEADCGFYVPRTQPELFIEKIQPFLHSSEGLAEAQRRAGALAASNFSKEVLLPRLMAFVRALQTKS